MSNQVDRVGTFRFDKVLSVSLNIGKDVSEDDPQPRSITFSALLHLSEFWDTEMSEWVDWAEADAEIVAFLPLHFFDFKKTQKQEEFSIRKKVVEVFGWDGGSFKVLCTGDYSEVKGQVRLADNTYEKAKFPFKVEWLDTYDATPGRQLRQITGEDLDKLDKIMVGKTQKTAKSTKAATVKGKGKGKPTGRPTAPKATPPAEKTDVAVGKCTLDDAYNECHALKRDDVTDELLNELWVKELAKVNVDENKITEEEAFVIKTKLLTVTAKV
jgi:hypothetical protein